MKDGQNLMDTINTDYKRRTSVAKILKMRRPQRGRVKFKNVTFVNEI